MDSAKGLESRDIGPVGDPGEDGSGADCAPSTIWYVRRHCSSHCPAVATIVVCITILLEPIANILYSHVSLLAASLSAIDRIPHLRPQAGSSRRIVSSPPPLGGAGVAPNVAIIHHFHRHRRQHGQLEHARRPAASEREGKVTRAVSPLVQEVASPAEAIDQCHPSTTAGRSSPAVALRLRADSDKTS